MSHISVPLLFELFLDNSFRGVYFTVYSSCQCVMEFDNRNKSLTANVLKQGLSSTAKVFKQGYQYHKLR